MNTSEDREPIIGTFVANAIRTVFEYNVQSVRTDENIRVTISVYTHSFSFPDDFPVLFEIAPMLRPVAMSCVSKLIKK